jgi:phosphatidylglycerophosphatase A
VSRIALFLATAGYAGFSPIAPGTAGSIVGLALYVVLRWIDSALVEASAIALVLVLGIWTAGIVEEQLGKDPGPVVIDEVLGMLITLAFLDVTPLGAFVGFVLFRVYDVIKPYPAGRLEDLHGGPGIMLDDLMAGLYGQLTMRVLIAMFPGVLG